MYSLGRLASSQGRVHYLRYAAVNPAWREITRCQRYEMMEAASKAPRSVRFHAWPAIISAAPCLLSLGGGGLMAPVPELVWNWVWGAEQIFWSKCSTELWMLTHPQLTPGLPISLQKPRMLQKKRLVICWCLMTVCSPSSPQMFAHPISVTFISKPLPTSLDITTLLSKSQLWIN